MKIYLLLDVLTLLCPLLLSLERRRVNFSAHWLRATVALLPAGVFFIVWDIIAVARQHWSFNPLYVSGVNWMGLPVEELLFFFVVPFACIFIYHCAVSFSEDRKWPVLRWVMLSLAPFAAVPVFVFQGQEYTQVVFALTTLFLGLAPFIAPDIITSRRFWVAMGFIFIAFLVVNTVLTALPVVIYNPAMITGLRIITIPVEDFFYNLTLMGISLVIFERLKGLMQKA